MLIPRPPKGREEAPVQISRLLHAHEVVLKEARAMARRAAESGDDGTNDRDWATAGVLPPGFAYRDHREWRHRHREERLAQAARE